MATPLRTLLLLAPLLHAACAPSAAGDLDQVERQVRERFPTVRQISPEELERGLGSPLPPLLLDVRSPAEHEVSHLPGAVLAPDLPRALKRLAETPKDRPIVVYCSVGYRSSQLAEQLAAAGFTDVSNLEGSIFGWANSGRPVFRGSERVRQVHPYDADWGQLLDPVLRAPLDGGAAP